MGETVESVQQQPATPAPSSAPATPSPAPAGGERPAWLPSKYETPEALAKGYTELQAAFSGKQEKLRETVLAELRAGVPEAPDKYELKAAALPEHVVWLDGDIPAELEAGKVYFKPDPAAPEMGALREWAHKNGVKSEGFGELMGLAAQVMGTRVPTAAEVEAQRTAFYGSLGENGQARASHLWGQLTSALGDKAKGIDALLSDKGSFEAIEALMSRAGGASFAPAGGGAAPGSAMDEATLRKAPSDPRYGKDKTFMAEVEAGWRRLYADPLPTRR